MLRNIPLKFFLFILSLAITMDQAFIKAEDKRENYEPEIYYRNCNEFQCEIAWDKLENFSSVDEPLYHIFLSDTEKDLMPTAVPQEYLNTKAAEKKFLTTTDAEAISLPRVGGYARIIAQCGHLYKDVAELIGIDPSPEELAKHPIADASKIRPLNWSAITPYLLPESCPLQSTLNKIFSKQRVLRSLHDIKEAGFTILFHREGRGLIVARHPLVKKYIFKMYLDTLPKSEWPLFVKRAKGARMIQEIIEKNHFEEFVKAPKKFIYKLPSYPSAEKGENVYPKSFILLVEDMNIADDATNKNYYAKAITRGHLKSIKHIIEKCGLSDSHIGNIPFSHDNKIAFIDTEYINTWPVHLEWITGSLKGDKKKYWLSLLNQK